MEQHFWIALAASCVAALFTTSGIFLIRVFDAKSRDYSSYFSCFAAGMLISVSFLHIVPESIEMNKDAPVYMLCGYLFMHFINRFLTAYVCDKPTNKKYVLGILPILGIGLHSFIDGIIYSVAYTVSIFTGILATSGMILHEFSEGIVTYTLLIQGGFNKKIATILAFIAAALTTPLGMLSSYPFIKQINDISLGAMLGLSAGTLIYVGATHLLPHAEREHKKYSLLALFAGIFAAAIIMHAEH